MRVVVTRPRPGATAAAWRGRGATVLVAPLMEVAAVAWTPPPLPLPPDAVAMTSANAARLAGPAAAPLYHLPLFCVGGATAAAARAAGWKDVRDVSDSGDGTANALFAAVAGIGTVLHLAGANRIAAAFPPGLAVEVRVVYRARLLDLPAHVAALLGDGGWTVLLYSPRTAHHFAAQAGAAGIDRSVVAIAALSPAVAVAAGPGWHRVAVAARPDDAALFAAAETLCDKDGNAAAEE